MQDRLARAGVVHLAGVDAEHHVVGVVVVVHQDLVAAHPHVGRDVALLGLADQRVDVEPVADLERGLGQVLVGAVDRVAGLEGDDPLPAAVGERLPRLLGGLVAAHERLVVVGQRVGLDRAGEAAGALLADRGDARVLVVGRPVDLLGLELDVALVDLLDRQPPERLAVRGAELDHVADLALEVGRKRDRDRPDLAAGQAHVLAHRTVVVGAHEALERREAAVCEQLEVRGLACGERQRQGGLGATHLCRTRSGRFRPSGRLARRRQARRSCRACIRSTDIPDREVGCRARGVPLCSSRLALRPSRPAGSASRGRSARPSRTSARFARVSESTRRIPETQQLDVTEGHAHRLDLAVGAAAVLVDERSRLAVRCPFCSAKRSNSMP